MDTSVPPITLWSKEERLLYMVFAVVEDCWTSGSREDKDMILSITFIEEWITATNITKSFYVQTVSEIEAFLA